MCLALQSLIAAPTEHVVPAVQSRVHELISHNSSVGSFYRAAGHAWRTKASNPTASDTRLPPFIPPRAKLVDARGIRAAKTARWPRSFCCQSNPVGGFFARLSGHFCVWIILNCCDVLIYKQDAEQLSKVKSTIHDLAFNNGVCSYVLNLSAVLSAFGLGIIP